MRSSLWSGFTLLTDRYEHLTRAYVQSFQPFCIPNIFTPTAAIGVLQNTPTSTISTQELFAGSQRDLFFYTIRRDAAKAYC